MDNPEDRLINVKEVARKCGVGVATVYRMSADGRLPQPLKLGACCVRWSLTEIEAALCSMPRVDYVATAPKPVQPEAPRRGRKPICLG